MIDDCNILKFEEMTFDGRLANTQNNLDFNFALKGNNSRLPFDVDDAQLKNLLQLYSRTKEQKKAKQDSVKKYHRSEICCTSYRY